MSNIKKNNIYNIDCMLGFKHLADNTINMTLTDIPYDSVSRQSNGLRNLDKGKADVLTFNLIDFLEEVYRVTNGVICIFCGKEQFSEIYNFFAQKQGTVRPIIWEKTNPSPMNGQYVYLSGVEFAVWFKKKGYKTFNAHCKNTVFKFPNGKNKIHETEKNLNLFQELLLDNTNEADLILDPCFGSGTTIVAAILNKRNYIGFELNQEYFYKAENRISNIKNGL